jgi:hypothetical protein
VKPSYIFLALALVGVIVLAEQNRRLRAKSDRQESVIREKTDSLRYERNRAGQLVAEKAAAEVTLKELQTNYGAELRQIREELGVAKRELKAFVKSEFEARGTGETTIEHHHHYDNEGNVVRVDSFRIKDGYLDMLGSIRDSTRISYEYTYTDEILHAFQFRRKWAFGKQELYSVSRLRNPNARVTNSTAVLVNEYKDKRWVISTGVSWTPFSPVQFQPSITVGYAWIKF